MTYDDADRADLSGAQVHLILHSDEIDGFKRWLGERRAGDVLAFDTETSGLSCYAHDARIRLVQVGDAMNGWAIPWDLWRGLALETLTEYDGPLVGHNVAFDIKWLEQMSDWTAPWHRIHDTMIASRIADPTASAALKTLSTRYVDRAAAHGERMLDAGFAEHGWTWNTVPIEFPAYWQYAALDTVLTARLHAVMQSLGGSTSPYAEAYDLEMAIVRIVTKMEQRGARVDLSYAEKMLEACEERAETLRTYVQDVFGINVASPSLLGRKLIEHGAEIMEFTPTGQPKIDKYQLLILTDPDNEYPKAVRVLASVALQYRKYAKLAASYFSNFVTLAVPSPEGDLIHASINPLAARTGRMSISNPALQQLPRGDAMVRDAFIAREGHSLISTDFSQIEMRMMAHFSGDPELVAAFQHADASGGDFFVEIGREVYRDPKFNKKDKRRNLIKSTMYGLAYGAGPTKMAETAGVPVDRMKTVVDGITSRYPGIKAFMREVEDLGKRRERSEGRGWIDSLDGRRLFCDSNRVYTLVNYKIQSSAAVAYKRALIRLDAAGYGPYFLVPVHDEILVDIPSDLVGEALHDIPRVMDDASLTVDIPADAEGPYQRWGEKYAS